MPNPTIWESAIPCDLSGVRTVLVPATTEPDSPLLRLRYRVFETDPDAPWVFVVPGGPGQALMKEDPAKPFALGAVPSAAFNIVYTDARGSGCNVFSELQTVPAADVYTIEQVAADLALIVEQESPSEFYLYGSSFGSAVVTVAAHRMEQAGAQPPSGIVLEGTVGRAFTSFDAYFSAFETEWQRVLPMLSAEWQSNLTTEPFVEPRGWSRNQWGAFVSAQLILGDFPGNGPLLDYWLEGLTAETVSAVQYVDGFMSGIPAGVPTQPPGGLFTTIACRELWGQWQPGRALQDGDLQAVGNDPCSGLQQPFDAALYLSTVPTTYLHGPFDPTTTTAQAAYHFDVHLGAPRSFVTVPEASHAPLTLGLAARGCAPDVWQAIRGQADLSAVLAACSLPNEMIGLEQRND